MWYRVRAIKKNSLGQITARGSWSPAILYDFDAFVTADGIGVRRKDSTGDFLKLNGINLGNYFSWEPWMLFGLNHPFVEDDVYPDDWTIRQQLRQRQDINESGLEKIVQAYQSSYITEADLDNLMRLGINLIRIPLYVEEIRPIDDFGNWKTSDFDFSAIDRIVRLSGDRGMYVILDLHGAPGCQSDKDATGRVDFNKLFHPDPAKDIFRDRSVELWRALAEHYKTNTTIMGYDLLNEPYGVLTAGYYNSTAEAYQALWSLYDRMYEAIRSTPANGGAGDSNHLIIMESVPSEREWDTLPNPVVDFGWTNIMYQFHYYGFNFDNSGEISGTKTYDEHIEYLNDKIANSKQALYDVPVLIGECNGFDDARVWDLLIDTFNDQGWAWCVWSYKNHNSNEWGLYVHADYDEDVPDPANDSLDDLIRKMSKYLTYPYHKPNNTLLNIIKTKTLLPGFIYDLQVVEAKRKVKLNWSLPDSAAAIKRYIIHYGTVESGSFAYTKTVRKTRATIRGLINGTAYQFKVEAVSKNGSGPTSNIVIATPHKI